MRTFATAARAAPAATPFLVQRCSCGSAAQPASDMCEECQEKEALGLQPKLTVGAIDDPAEREADAAARAVGDGGTASVAAGPVARVSRSATAAGTMPAPPSVTRAIGRAGEPLGRAERAFFEPRFGHDFGNVRVHRDAAAAASAQEIAARAYTVGQHVVFGAGAFAPATREGRRLLAHELTHVVQQRGTVQRHAASPEFRVRSSTGEEEEQREEPATEREEETEGTVQRFPRGEMFGDEPSEPWPEKAEAARIAAETRAMYQCLKDEACSPSTPLTWADFKGVLPANARFGAETFSDLRIAANPAPKCMKGTMGAVDQNPRALQGFINRNSSRAKLRFKNPGNMALNGCQAHVAKCRTFFNGLGPGQTGTMAMDTTPDAACPAGMTPRGDTATSAAECTTVLGKDCKDTAIAESARLLAHEQGHLDLTCAIAHKANAQVEKDTDLGALRTEARRVLNEQQDLYDSEAESDHGCDAGNQAKWEKDIADGLPDVTISVP